MMPPSPRRPLTLLIAASFALLSAGCDKPPEDEALPPRAVSKTTQLPSPSPESCDRTGRKALSAFNAVSVYLKDQDPDLREKLQKAAERIVRDKDKWRTHLKDRQRELQPRIAKARDQISKAEGKSADALGNLRQELATLESQRSEAEHKLAELESITGDTWKSFRDRLKFDDEPTPSPASNKR